MAHETDKQWAMRRSQEKADEEGRPYIITVDSRGRYSLTAFYPHCQERDDFLCIVNPRATPPATGAQPQ